MEAVYSGPIEYASMIKLSEVQLKIYTLREMHMHFQHINAAWIKGFIN